jgi:uncharacterized iron-regulated protein
MLQKLIFTIVFLSNFIVFSQNDGAFVIYSSKGKKVSLEKMLTDISLKEAIFFGEQHDNPIAHWIELQVLKRLEATCHKDLVVGFEMYEHDQQELLTQFLAKQLSEKQFNDTVRQWNNYATDYKPLLLFMQEKQLKGVATNVPRKFANLLFKKGYKALDTLSLIDKSNMVPLPFNIDSTLTQYAALKEMEEHMGGKHMMAAQALKDATMAYFLLESISTGKKVLHFNGAYHTDFFQGILWYVQQVAPKIKTVTISTVTQQSTKKLEKEHLNKASYIICVAEDMTRTY